MPEDPIPEDPIPEDLMEQDPDVTVTEAITGNRLLRWRTCLRP